MVPETKTPLNNKPLTPAMEDYLEAIFDLSQNKKVVRVKDIARRLDVKMPTVTSMLRTLRGKGLVHYEKYEYVELTKDGTTVGKDMRHRHDILLQFLTEVLKIDQATADEDACKMEHALSVDTLDSLTDFMAFIQSCPRAGQDWLNYFEEYRREGQRPEKCRARMGVLSDTLKEWVAPGKEDE
jgi:DtxR family Mn-dependent transcriptional regulator